MKEEILETSTIYEVINLPLNYKYIKLPGITHKDSKYMVSCGNFTFLLERINLSNSDARIEGIYDELRNYINDEIVKYLKSLIPEIERHFSKNFSSNKELQLSIPYKLEKLPPQEDYQIHRMIGGDFMIEYKCRQLDAPIKVRNEVVTNLRMEINKLVIPNLQRLVEIKR